MQKRGIIQRPGNMEKCGDEKRHPERNMDSVPDRQQLARPRQRDALGFSGRRFQFNAIQRARDAGVYVATDETACHDDDGK